LCGFAQALETSKRYQKGEKAVFGGFCVRDRAHYLSALFCGGFFADSKKGAEPIF